MLEKKRATGGYPKPLEQKSGSRNATLKEAVMQTMTTMATKRNFCNWQKRCA